MGAGPEGGLSRGGGGGLTLAQETPPRPRQTGAAGHCLPYPGLPGFSVLRHREQRCQEHTAGPLQPVLQAQAARRHGQDTPRRPGVTAAAPDSRPVGGHPRHLLLPSVSVSLNPLGVDPF